MFKKSISLIELSEKHANADFMRELGEWTLHRLMELEVESQIGAEKHERSDDRAAHRNGYRERALETRVGTMSLEDTQASIWQILPIVFGASASKRTGFGVCYPTGLHRGSEHPEGR